MEENKDIKNQAIWAIVPAAGSGKRMQNRLPKQYLAIAGKPVLQWTLQALIKHPKVDGIVVGAAQDDTDCKRIVSQLSESYRKPILISPGGTERAMTVHNAIERLLQEEQTSCFALVHDAARPCVSQAEIDALIKAISYHQSGAVLALPVADTLKRANGDTIVETVERTHLWRAQTPQLYDARQLLAALKSCLELGKIPTDESQAMEWQGCFAKLVAGSANNIKLTYEQDIETIRRYLEAQND